MSQALKLFGFADDRNWFTSQGTLVDESRSFKDNSIEGDAERVFKKYDIARDDVFRWDLDDFALPQDVHINFVVCHLINFLIQVIGLVQIDGDSECRSEKNYATVVHIVFADPYNQGRKDKKIQGPNNLSKK